MYICCKAVVCVWVICGIVDALFIYLTALYVVDQQADLAMDARGALLLCSQQSIVVEVTEYN